MDLLRPIIKNLTADFYARRDSQGFAKYLGEYMESQYWPVEKLRQYQEDQIRQLLKYVYNQNEFYRKRLDGIGFEPGDFNSMDDLKSLPILTKNNIREAGQSLFSNGYNTENTEHKRTGGSTGVPLHIYIDPPAAARKKAAVRRHSGWANWDPGTKVAAVWGDTEKKKTFKQALRNLLTDRTIYLDTLHFTPERINAFLDKIKQRSHQILMGHAHSIFRLAEYIKDEKRLTPRFDGIITTAMVLSPLERQLIEQVFEAPVFNRYGCEELSIIASECDAHNGLHIFAEGLYVEHDQSKADHPQPLIITDLLNQAMPLIRYEIGDSAVSADGECPCGRTLPRLGEISGRTADFLYTPEEEPVFGISILDTFMIHIPGFKQVQIIQDRYDHLDFNIVQGSEFSEASLDRLQQNVVEIFGPNMQYDVYYVDKIEQTERGKFRFSICKINKESRDD